MYNIKQIHYETSFIIKISKTISRIKILEHMQTYCHAICIFSSLYFSLSTSGAYITPESIFISTF